jgi:hypothetical protein
MACTTFRRGRVLFFEVVGSLVLFLLGWVTNALGASLVLATNAYPVVTIDRLAVVTCVPDPHSDLLLHALTRCLGLRFGGLPILVAELEVILFEYRSGLLQSSVNIGLSGLFRCRLGFRLWYFLWCFLWWLCFGGF